MKTLKIKKYLLFSLCVFMLVLALLGAHIAGLFPRLVRAEESVAKNVKWTDLWEEVKYTSITTEADIPDTYTSDVSSRKGVKVLNRGNGSEIRYKNAVNISNLTSKDKFMEIAIIVEVQREMQFSSLTIRLTDAENPDNYVDMKAFASIWDYSTTYFQAGANDMELGGLLTGTPSDTALFTGGKGTECYLGTFRGWPPAYNQLGNRIEYPLTFRYDTEEKAVYCDNRNFSATQTPAIKTLVRDLDDPIQVGYGNEWEGFTSDRVYVSIIANDFSNSTGTYVITNFMGLDMSQNTVPDTEGPALQTEADNVPEILTCVVDREYPFFNAKADDIVEGRIEKIVKEITTPGGEKKVYEGDSFIPTETGTYTLKYVATDSHNNRNEKVYSLKSIIVNTPMELQFESPIPTEGKVGETIVLPKATLTGGVGKPDYTIKVVRPLDGTVCEVTNHTFKPLTKGEFEIAYCAEDYLGDKKIIKEYVSVERSFAPIGDFPYISEYMIVDKTVKLPEMKAYDYVSDPSYGKKATVDIYISYEKDSLGSKLNGLFFTPMMEAGTNKKTVYITYRTYCEGYDDEAYARKKTYEISIVRMNQLTDNFTISSNIEYSYAPLNIEFSTASDGASMKYLTPVSASNFELLFDIPTEKNNFSVLKLTLTDSENDAKNIVMEITKEYQSKKSFVYVNGKKFRMNGSFDGLSQYSFNLIFSADGKSVKDLAGSQVCKFTTFADGTEYDGFPSGRFYLTFEFVGVTGESAIQLQRIADQSIYGNITNGILNPFVDRSSPIVVLNEEIISRADRYQKIVLPVGRVYDAIDPWCDCYVSVTRGSKIILEQTKITDTPLSFIPKEFGKYSVNYYAMDKSGNETFRSFTVYVEDLMPPTITLKEAVKDTMSVGDLLFAPSAVALDTESETTLRVFIINPRSDISLVENGKYTMDMAGKYILRYCAYDSSYNYTIVDYSITVK